MPIELPEWGTDQTNELEPSESLKANGWANGDQPPASIFNWLGRTTYESLVKVRKMVSALVFNTWKEATTTGPYASAFYNVTWSNVLSAYVVTGTFSDANSLQTSPDGITWTSRTPGTATSAFYGMAESGSTVVLTGTNGRIETSTDGVTWTSRTSGTTNALFGVAWSGSRFVAVGEAGTIIHSTDGITWSAATAGSSYAYNFRDVVWSSILDMFVAVGDAGEIQTSATGTGTWTHQANDGSYADDFTEVVDSPELGLVLAVGDNAEVQTSLDGSTWTAQTLPVAYTATDDPRAACWSPELGLFLIANPGDALATSPDGIEWTLRPGTVNGASDVWLGATWSPDLGQFVLCGSSGAVQYTPGLGAL